MTITKIAMSVSLAATMAQASPDEQKLTVYLHDQADVVSAVRVPAQAMAAKMFAQIGVRLEWRLGEPVNPPSETRYLVMDLTTGTAGKFSPGALAFARPYEGVHITVFFDRIRTDTAPAKLLAHVMVHEITHLLQGVSRHSETGVMKARWLPCDFMAMRYRPLPFTAEDIDLIHDGLSGRIAHRDKPVAGDL